MGLRFVYLKAIRNYLRFRLQQPIWLVSFSHNPAPLPEACLLESLSLCLHSYPRGDHRLECSGQDSEQKP